MTECENVPFLVIPDLRHSRPDRESSRYVIPGSDRESTLSFPACVIPDLIGDPEDGNHPFFNVLLGELRREGGGLYPLFHRATIEDSLGRQRDSPGSRVKANLGKNRIELFPGEPWFSHRVSWKPGAKPLRPCVIGFPKRERRQILPAHAHGILGKLKNMSFGSWRCLCFHRSVHSS